MTFIATENKRYSNLVKEEMWTNKGYCKLAVPAYEATAKSYTIGAVLGRVISGGTATATADATNTGNGVMGTITVTAGAKIGKYRLVITAAASNAGTFLVVDPDGRAVGTGTVAAAFSRGGLAFTLADDTDYAVGDALTITVVGTYQYKIAVETATDGSNEVQAIVAQDTTVPATTATTVLVLHRGPAEISKAGLVFDATFDSAAKKLAVYDALEAKGFSVVDAS